MSKKQFYLYCIFVAILLIAFGLLVYTLFTRSSSTSPFLPTPTVTPLPPLIQAKEKSNIPLPSDDEQIIQKLKQEANPKTGYIIYRSNYSIVYLPNEAVFQIRIQSADVKKAKADALTFFTTAGISKTTLCKLPIVFYVNPAILAILDRQGESFSPLIENCQ